MTIAEAAAASTRFFPLLFLMTLALEARGVTVTSSLASASTSRTGSIAVVGEAVDFAGIVSVIWQEETQDLDDRRLNESWRVLRAPLFLLIM